MPHHVEKPLALNHGDAKALIDAVATAGRKMTIGYTLPVRSPALEMRAAIEWGVGKVVHVESWFGYNWRDNLLGIG